MTALASAALAAALLAAAPSDAVQRGYAPVNGLRIYYELHGPAGAKGPPLVLLHGGGSTIDATFARLLPALARHRRVIAFEQQGHGRTADLPDRPFTFEQSADDAAAQSVRRMLEFRDWPESEVRSISVPVLVVAGDRDAVLPEHAVALARMLPDARLAVLPGTDHDGVVRGRADWLVPMIEAFLDAR